MIFVFNIFNNIIILISIHIVRIRKEKFIPSKYLKLILFLIPLIIFKSILFIFRYLQPSFCIYTLQRSIDNRRIIYLYCKLVKKRGGRHVCVICETTRHKAGGGSKDRDKTMMTNSKRTRTGITMKIPPFRRQITGPLLVSLVFLPCFSRSSRISSSFLDSITRNYNRWEIGNVEFNFTTNLQFIFNRKKNYRTLSNV